MKPHCTVSLLYYSFLEFWQILSSSIIWATVENENIKSVCQLSNFSITKTITHTWNSSNISCHNNDTLILLIPRFVNVLDFYSINENFTELPYHYVLRHQMLTLRHNFIANSYIQYKAIWKLIVKSDNTLVLTQTYIYSIKKQWTFSNFSCSSPLIQIIKNKMSCFRYCGYNIK